MPPAHDKILATLTYHWRDEWLEIYLLVERFYFDRVCVFDNMKMECTTFKAYGWCIGTDVSIIVNSSICCSGSIAFSFFLFSFFCIFIFWLGFGFVRLFILSSGCYCCCCWRYTMDDAMHLSFSFNRNQMKTLHNDCTMYSYCIQAVCILSCVSVMRYMCTCVCIGQMTHPKPKIKYKTYFDMKMITVQQWCDVFRGKNNNIKKKTHVHTHTQFFFFSLSFSLSFSHQNTNNKCHKY